MFGLGAAKTGTHSLARIFEPVCEAAHESDARRLIRRVLERERHGDAAALVSLLRRRDARRQLHVDSSQVNLYLIDELETLFGNSRYVMTVRHPVDWLRSIIDDTMRRDASDVWLAFREFRFGARADGTRPEERALAARGLHSLDGYLSYWRDAVTRPLAQIPRDRLLVVRTKDLHPRAVDIADFCGLPRPVVSRQQAHAYANPQRFGVLSELPHAYLRERLEAVCGAPASLHFPSEPIEQVLDEALLTPSR